MVVKTPTITAVLGLKASELLSLSLELSLDDTGGGGDDVVAPLSSSRLGIAPFSFGL